MNNKNHDNKIKMFEMKRKKLLQKNIKREEIIERNENIIIDLKKLTCKEM